MDLLAQRLFDAMANGAVYATLAVAISMVFRASGVLNLAQGELAMFSAYIALLFSSEASPRLKFSTFAGDLGAPMPIWLAIIVAVLLSAAVGAVLERFVIRPLDGTSPIPAVGATLGLFLLVRALADRFWGGGARFIDSPFPDDVGDEFNLLGGRLRYVTVGIVLTLVAVLALLAIVQNRTKLGLAFRAVVSNRASAPLVGIRVDRIVMAGWAIAAALGGLSGGLIASQILITPRMMSRMLVFALASATLGGLGNPTGAVVGGFAFAILETLLIGYVPFVTSDVAMVWALGILVAVLVIRPGGIFGTSATKSVEL